MAAWNQLPALADGGIFHVVIESPRGCSVKLKYDPSLDAMTISRPLALGLVFPYDWGFVPSTNGPDGDPVDAIVLWDVATFPGVVIPCRPVAVLEVDQLAPDGRRIRNDRIIGRPTRERAELAEFIRASTALEGKDAKVLGWQGEEAVLALIRSSLV
jgi:inorganic pyrophosphatase